MSEITIRPVRTEDAPVLSAIYAPYVEQTAVSFEETPPAPQEFERRIEKSRAQWQWLVAEVDGAVVGYAYGTQHRERSAYRWSVEVSAYVDAEYHRRGVGRTLYEALFIDLAARGFCNAFAGITLPNDASIALHTRMGFTPIGVFRSIGWKFGRWHDVAWFQRQLRQFPRG